MRQLFFRCLLRGVRRVGARDAALLTSPDISAQTTLDTKNPVDTLISGLPPIVSIDGGADYTNQLAVTISLKSCSGARRHSMTREDSSMISQSG